jgi:hypothetical protein
MTTKEEIKIYSESAQEIKKFYSKFLDCPPIPPMLSTIKELCDRCIKLCNIVEKLEAKNDR